MSVSDVDAFVKSEDARAAVTKGIANVTGLPEEYVDVDLSVEVERRRLRAVDSHQSGVVRVTYAISVDGDAPESVTITGDEVGAKLNAANSANIQDAITSSIDESMGAGTFELSVQQVSEPNLETPNKLEASSGSVPCLVSHGLVVLAVVLLPVF